MRAAVGVCGGGSTRFWTQSVPRSMACPAHLNGSSSLLGRRGGLCSPLGKPLRSAGVGMGLGAVHWSTGLRTAAGPRFKDVRVDHRTAHLTCVPTRECQTEKLCLWACVDTRRRLARHSDIAKGSLPDLRADFVKKGAKSPTRVRQRGRAAAPADCHSGVLLQLVVNVVVS